MRKSFSAFLGLPVAILTVAGVSVGLQDPDPTPQPSQYIGVVDALKALNGHPKFIDANARWQEVDRAFRANAKTMEDAIVQQELDIAALDAGALDQREASAFQLDLRKRELEGQAVMHERRLAREMAILSVDLYADIWEATAKVAENRGLKLVLRKRELVPGIPLENVQRHHERVAVAYAAPELDVTEHVIRLLK